MTDYSSCFDTTDAQSERPYNRYTSRASLHHRYAQRTSIQWVRHIALMRTWKFSNRHVDISKSSREEFLFSTWGRKNSSEESNETSEEMNHAHVENKKYPRGDLRFPTWVFEKGG